MSFVGEAVGCAVAIVLTIVLIQVVGFADPKEKEESDTEKAAQMRKFVEKKLWTAR